jgi:hypothetical protein
MYGLKKYLNVLNIIMLLNNNNILILFVNFYFFFYFFFFFLKLHKEFNIFRKKLKK